MDVMASPYKLATDSPSRQLLWELNQLAISSQEDFYAHLDRENDHREALHRHALSNAAEEHDRVRRSAEFERERLELQIQAERRRRDEEARRDLEKKRQEKADEEKAVRTREAERTKAAEFEKQKAAEAQSLEDAAQKRKEESKRHDEEIVKRLMEEKLKSSQPKEHSQSAKDKTTHPVAASQKARSIPTPAPTSAPETALTDKNFVAPSQQSLPTAPAPRNIAWESEHDRYLEIHQNLKKLRKFMTDGAKQNPGLKQAVGDMRRDIKKSVGQVRENKEKGTNTVPLQKIMTTLKKALTISEPKTDVTLFLATPPGQVDDPNGPALLVYLLNIFAKAIIAQFIDEAGVKPLIADPVGTVASHIFALSDFRWNGLTLIDILIAKMHVVCPVLFGIYGSDQSPAGKQRLGWWREEKDGPFISEQRHFERMTGLGAGFAGIALKNYEKARVENPYPDHHYWQSLARVTRLPPHEITPTHFVVLKGMIENYEAKFLQFYGDAALAALRLVLIELPRKAPPSVAAKSLGGLVDVLKRDKKLLL